jgi:hypothetical protein
MPKRDAELLEVFVRQVAKYGDIHPILGKTLSVLTKVELLKPVRNLLHCGPPAINPNRPSF